MFNKHLRAFSLIEIILSVAMIAVLVAGSYDVLRISLETAELARQNTLAELMAQDLLELTVSKRNENWNSLAAGTYHFIEDPLLGIIFAAGAESVNQYTRSVVLTSVQRDGAGNVVSAGGTVDADSFIAEAIVTWQYAGQNREARLTQLLTNWKDF